ncbi:hypothetical protein B0H13DRAFT_2570196 [Mycena leptocephala]|nr:hypothetical protein B0H13DRAFT_2570196 [Mycena leptocephala]
MSHYGCALFTTSRYHLFPNTLFLTYFTSIFIFQLAPGILRRYPHPYTFALANASAWAGDKIQQGLTSLTFFIAFATACYLSVSAYRNPASGISEAHTWTGTLLIFFFFLFSASSFVCLLLFVHPGVVSRQNSVLKNIGALALWILRGWEVAFFYGLFAALVAYVQVKRRSAAAAREAEPTEVLSEGWMLEEQDNPAPPEKAYTEKTA